MNNLCPISIYAGKPGCDGVDEPVNNFSSEAAETLYFTGIGFPIYNPYVPPPLGGGMYVAANCAGVEVSASSQEEADLLMKSNSAICQITHGGGGIAVGGTGTGAPAPATPTSPPPTVLASVVNSPKSAFGSCSSLATFTYTVPAGSFTRLVDASNISAISSAQSAVDAQAQAYAQQRVNNADHCIGSTSPIIGVIGMCAGQVYGSTNLFVLSGSPTGVNWVSSGLPPGISLVPGTTTAVTDGSGDSWVEIGGGIGGKWMNLTTGATQQGQPQGTSSGNTGTADLFGTPTQTGDYHFTVTAYFGQNSSTFTGKITVIEFLNTSPLPDGTFCAPLYQQPLQAAGGTKPYTFSVDPTTQLPNGLNIVVGFQSVLLQGRTSPGTYNFKLIVTDSVGIQCGKDFTLTMNPPATQPSFTTGSPLVNAYVGSIYDTVISTTGGCQETDSGLPPWQFAVVGGSLPPSFKLYSSNNLSSCTMIGYPGFGDAGTWNFTIQATDWHGQTGTKAFTLTVVSNPIVWGTTSPLPNGSICSAYSQTLSVSGGYPAAFPAAPYTFSVDPLNPLPAGLTLVGGVLSGMLSAGTYNFQLIATDTVQSSGKVFTLTVPANPIVWGTTSPLPNGSICSSYSQTLSVSGGCPAAFPAAPYTFSVDPLNPLPAGLTLSGAVLSGVLSSGNYSFTLIAHDSLSQFASKAFTLTVDPSATQPSFTTASPLPQANVSIPYSTTIVATGGCFPRTISLVSGSLPSSLTLSGFTISGTPTAGEAGDYSFTLKATDWAGQTATKAFTLHVHAFDVVISGTCANNPSISGFGGADNVTAYPTTRGYRLHANSEATQAAAISNLNSNLTALGCGCPPLQVNVDPSGTNTTFYNSSGTCTITAHITYPSVSPYNFGVGPGQPFNYGDWWHNNNGGYPNQDTTFDIGGGVLFTIHYSTG